ncbi:permease [Shewanella canadensis]|uniref:Permease n=1 Tax=Shewanella canadensis TaxID=271096 RepID=A0A3S0KWS8_9GAMM|nr:Bax inhibitor-1 family protein [Shewanella canadensis]RTR40280.1 permease [Shewanella canadensis]
MEAEHHTMDCVNEAPASERLEFIKNTYVHLGYAILAFIVLEGLLLSMDSVTNLVSAMTGKKWSWPLVLGLFMGVSWVADNWARSEVSKETQYAGLVLYVVAEAVVFVPLMYQAMTFAPDLIAPAGLITLLLVFGLSFTVYTTKTDFSILRPALMIGSFVAVGVILASIIFGFSLGIIFSGTMIVFASASILYTTHSIQNEYRTDQYVAASLHLFAAIALLFWYVLRFLMQLNSDE